MEEEEEDYTEGLFWVDPISSEERGRRTNDLRVLKCSLAEDFLI